MPAGGYFGRVLVVDATSGTSENRLLPDGVLRGCIGGSGLGTWLLWPLGAPGADLLGSAAPLASNVGSLGGIEGLADLGRPGVRYAKEMGRRLR
jgi:aldehyde:ferredoxin oxidoreductase